MLKFIKNMQKRRIGIISTFLMCREVIISANVGPEWRGISKGFFNFLEMNIAYCPNQICDEVKD